LRPAEGGWHVAADDWRLRVAADAGDRGGAPARVVLVDAAAARADDGRWVRRADVWLEHDGAADLRAAWPRPVRLVAATLDGRSLPVADGPADTLSVPLPETGGAHELSLT